MSSHSFSSFPPLSANSRPQPLSTLLNKTKYRLRFIQESNLLQFQCQDKQPILQNICKRILRTNTELMLAHKEYRYCPPLFEHHKFTIIDYWHRLSGHTACFGHRYSLKTDQATVNISFLTHLTHYLWEEIPIPHIKKDFISKLFAQCTESKKQSISRIALSSLSVLSFSQFYCVMLLDHMEVLKHLNMILLFLVMQKQGWLCLL